MSVSLVKSVNWPVKDYFVCTSLHLHSDGREAIVCHLWDDGW